MVSVLGSGEEERDCAPAQLPPYSIITSLNNTSPADRHVQPPPTQVAIPLAKAGACFQALQRAVYDTPPGLWQGFRTPPLIRFLSGEGAYVSPAHGGPVVYINLEDYLRVSLNKSNEEFMVGIVCCVVVVGSWLSTCFLHTNVSLQITTT